MKKKKAEKILKPEPYKNRKTLFVYLALRALVIAGIVLSALRRDWHSVFYCVLSLILFVMPSIFEKKLAIELPATLEIIILCFIFAAEILGEINSFYVRVPHWDTVLHTLNGFLCAAIGFSLVDLLNRSDRFSIKLSPIFLAVVAFCFSMTVGVLWEFFEYSMDLAFHSDMQKDTVISEIYSVEFDETRSNKVVAVKDIKEVKVVHSDGSEETLSVGGYLDIGLHDTMKDLIVNFIGAVVFSFIGFFYVKARGRGNFAKQFIPIVKDGNGMIPEEIKGENKSDGEIRKQK